MTLSNMQVFKKLWLIVFKPLYAIMLAVLAYRTGILFWHGEGEDVSVGSVAVGLTIATVGIAVVSALIALPFVKFQRKE